MAAIAEPAGPPAPSRGTETEGAFKALTAAKPKAAPFTSLLQAHRMGEMHDDLSVKVREAVASVRETGKKATVTLTLEFAPAGRSRSQVLVRDSIKAKLPEVDVEDSTFYVDENGNLHRNNPKQMELPREVLRPEAAEPREVN